MSADFEAIVKLCRRAARNELLGASLHLAIEKNDDVVRLVDEASAYRVPDIFIGGRQQHEHLSHIADGIEVELRFDGLTSNQKVIAQNLRSMLKYQQGFFLYKAPPEYYLLDEKYAIGDPVVPGIVQAYQRVPRLFDFIQSISDVTLDSGSPFPSFVVLGGKRLDIVANYSVDVLAKLPPADEIEALIVTVQTAPLLDAKRGLFKKVLVRLLEATPKELRFAKLVERFAAIVQAFEADFDLYQTEFNFEKIREGFEQKRLAFVLQLNATTTDLLGKVLAIPLGQGLIVSQLKDDPNALIGNVALMIGSLVFALLALLLILNQQNSLKQIKLEIKLESEALQARFPQLYERIEDIFKLLRRRATWHIWGFPVVIGLLLLATTVYSGYAFSKVPPWSGNAEAVSKVPSAPR
ncbi:hypothetical protein NYL07_02925 [Xanthomonas translucens pv. translucens]|uniref:hypothetical protein n=1 Tax=Xanthomonas campestris pv. translucens TaxID=343 RepID=UPI001F37399F|nr:hypothetical protein [Xanthomonas translucens]MCS3358832.1 hypothetical protein [Xanthomonas translucens pv. translucens]MCS3373001.1 hypothetical protein [Xanthomonas translucens pv. translucens]MCT8288205.1 hypothetical protein [Xanthomonas translucens pv. translucens]MCT8291960.1 hypothetical protein [Xanthomonas translucens pv. translucens]MCT8311908.1 hypothetical protein [Xanthomonas translucens pv. translucens]